MHLQNFDGPFELLLALVTARRLDITEVSLAQVTDDFVAHLAARRAQQGFDLSEASGFLVVAATLLDLKAAALLPREEGAAGAEEALRLEARDLLFARLLQYRAYAAAAAHLGRALLAESARVARGRPAEAEPGGPLAGAVPQLELTTAPAELAALAAAVLARSAEREGAPLRPPPGVDLSHLHAPRASVPEQVALLTARLRTAGVLGFDALVADAGAVPVVVGRFLALLQMFAAGRVDLEQADPLTPLTVRWVPA